MKFFIDTADPGEILKVMEQWVQYLLPIWASRSFRQTGRRFLRNENKKGGPFSKGPPFINTDHSRVIWVPPQSVWVESLVSWGG
jgi:hypothetical protein